jgi:hypothetical protein
MVEAEPQPDEESTETAEVVEESEDSTPESEPQALLRGSDLLTPVEASSLAAVGDSRLVVWAGEPDSGKTTLSAEIYERHRRREAHTSFAGSETLLGFEERIHLSRVESGRVTPRTKRTDLDPDERELLHLRVQGVAGRTDLLIADIPGEVFRRIRDHEISTGDVPLLSQAEKFVIVVDGGLIARPGARTTATHFAQQLVGELTAGDLPGEKMDVLLLLTKLDRLRDVGPEALSYWDEHRESLLADLRKLNPQATALTTAARFSGDQSDGMEELMEWLLSQPPDPAEPDLDEPAAPGRFQRIRAPRTSV